jgi:hypothetical protein
VSESEHFGGDGREWNRKKKLLLHETTRFHQSRFSSLHIHVCKWQAISFASTAFNKKSLSRQNDHQKLRAKLRAKPFYSCQHHWTKMDKNCVAPALQLNEAASQQD